MESQRACLFRVELLPPLLVALHEEDGGGLGLREVYEGVAQVALVLVVDGQVEEVVLAAVKTVKN